MEKIIKELNKLIQKAIKADESPVAAVIVHNNRIIAKAYNKRNKSNITTDHAEIIAIRKANKVLHSWRTNECTLYVTMEPCDMCKSVIKESRISKVVFFLKRSNEKKQYDKTVFDIIDSPDFLTKNFIEEYKKIVKNFWQNKR